MGSKAHPQKRSKRGRARAIAWTAEEIDRARADLVSKLGHYHVPAEQHAAWIAHLNATAAIGGDITATMDLLDERCMFNPEAEAPPAPAREQTRERAPLPKARGRSRSRRRAPRRMRRGSRRVSAVASAGSGLDGPPEPAAPAPGSRGEP